MWIPELKRHVAVCAAADVPAYLRREPKFWNVVSIRDPGMPPPPMIGARRVHAVSFHDIEDATQRAAAGFRAPRREDIEGILAFADETSGEALLVHCRAGISRSSAAALCLVMRAYAKAGRDPLVGSAVDMLLAIRPAAVPNTLMLKLGFPLFLEAERAAELVLEIANHPELVENRFVNPLRQ